MALHGEVTDVGNGRFSTALTDDDTAMTTAPHAGGALEYVTEGVTEDVTEGVTDVEDAAAGPDSGASGGA